MKTLGRNAKHKWQWRNSLKAYAYPTLGTRPISAIDGALITETLAHIWTKKPEKVPAAPPKKLTYAF